MIKINFCIKKIGLIRVMKYSDSNQRERKTPDSSHSIN